jgi:putative addiction module CopG family antidote
MPRRRTKHDTSTIEVSLTPELERFVRQRVTSGMYSTVGEVVRDALRREVDKERVREMLIDDLRAEVACEREASRIVEEAARREGLFQRPRPPQSEGG